METKQYIVPEHLDGSRLDKALAELAEGISRVRVRRAIEASAVRVDGRRRAKGALVASGETIQLEFADADNANSPAIASPDAPLTVLFESESVILVDKPAGQATAPLRSNETGTLVNALLGRFPELAPVGYRPREPGVLHRLDTGTSGIVLVGRTAAAFETLKSALKGDRLTKEYLLICTDAGLPDEGVVEFPLAPHPKDQRRVYACIHPRDVARNSPRPARTLFDVLDRQAGWALVRVEVSRALRHQIRVHFAAMGHPLAGDTLYGGPEIPTLNRHALHASRIRFAGGGGIAPFDIGSPLPAELGSLLAPLA